MDPSNPSKSMHLDGIWNSQLKCLGKHPHKIFQLLRWCRGGTRTAQTHKIEDKWKARAWLPTCHHIIDRIMRHMDSSISIAAFAPWQVHLSHPSIVFFQLKMDHRYNFLKIIIQCKATDIKWPTDLHHSRNSLPNR